MPKKITNPEDVVRSHEKEVLNSLQKHNLQQILVVNFPHKKKIPMLGRLGAWLVNISGGVISIKYGIINSNIAKK